MDKIVYAGIDIPFPASWRVRTIVEAAALRYPAWHQPTVRTLGEEFVLDPQAKCGELSRGQPSMVGIIIGLSARAPLTLLGEPYLGLDVQNPKVFYTRLLREREEHPRTTILATHHIEESAKLPDTFLILGRDGQLSHDCTAEESAEDYVSVDDISLPLISTSRSPARTRRPLAHAPPAPGAGEPGSSVGAD